MLPLNRTAIDEDAFPAFRLTHHIPLSPTADRRSGFRGKPAGEGDDGIILRADQRDMFGQVLVRLTGLAGEDFHHPYLAFRRRRLTSGLA